MALTTQQYLDNAIEVGDIEYLNYAMENPSEYMRPIHVKILAIAISRIKKLGCHKNAGVMPATVIRNGMVFDANTGARLD